MYQQKIGISIYNSYSIPTTDVIQMVKEIGFEAISPEWSQEVDLGELVQKGRDCGLIIQSLHAPYDQSANLWKQDAGVPGKNTLLQVLKDCQRWEIPVMVMHPWIGFQYTFDEDTLYYDYFDEIVAMAEEYGVHIAIENTEGEEFLFALMEHYRDTQNVGFCWDSGHEMCYNHSQDLLSKYGDRLIMTHINDNLGISRFDGKTFWTDDLHLLPFDGISDWNYNVDRLKKSQHMDILNFELNINSKPERHENDVYEQMTLEQYFTEAYKRTCKIAYKYSK
jgi:sugar phosphate isomerase/epimerase